MRTRAVALILTIGLLTTIAPAVAASHAGHTYQDSGTIDGTDRPAAYAVTAAKEYAIHDVPEGTDISATLTWDDDATRDMEVEMLPPAGSCEILPAPEVFCLAASASGHVDNADCDGATDPRSPGDDTSQTSVTTDRPGVWSVVVQATLLAPGDSVDYDVSFTVGEDHDGVTVGDVNFLQGDPHCFLVE